MNFLLDSDADVVAKDRLYRALDKALPHKEALMKHLQHRWTALFQADCQILLYDLTSTYFEGQVEGVEKAKRSYRPGRSAHEAIRKIHGLLNQRHRQVVDCDLSGYFDTIPHDRLVKSLARRISDGAMLSLIKKWLEMAVEEEDGQGVEPDDPSLGQLL